MSFERRRDKVCLCLRHHHTIVATGIIACGCVAVLWPEYSHWNAVGGTAINLIWLLVEPAS